MIWFILLPTVAGVWFFIGAYRDFGKVSDGLGFGALGALFAGVVAFFISMIAGLFVEREWTLTEVRPLVALRGESHSSGTFFLGTGSIEGRQQYFFYRQNKNGSFTAGRVPAEGVQVFEEDRKDAQIEIYTYAVKSDTAWLYALPIGGPMDEIIRVPKGTILRGFSL